MKLANAVKDAAASGNVIRGVHLTFAAPAVIEVLAAADLQFVYIDGEHGRFDWRDIEEAGITAERHQLTPIARISDSSSATITRFLDRGVRGIIAPHIESVEAARRVTDAAYFAPHGNRSYGPSHPHYGRRFPDRTAHLAETNATISVCLMIESKAGMDIAGELAAVPGVDYLSFGMLDLAQSLGHPGNSDHPAVKAGAAEAAARIRAAGKRVREDFMKYAWVNDLLFAGAQQLLGAAAK